MSIFQIGTTLFSLFMIYVVRINVRKLNLSRVEQLFWYSLWFVFAVIALFPNLLLGVVHALSFSRVFDLLTVLAMMVLTVIVIMTYFAQREAAKKMEEFIRNEAIRDAEK